MNESLFGQSHAQLLNVMEEMQIHLDIHFDHCALILTGLSRSRYMERLGMRRADLLMQMDEVDKALADMAQAQRFSYEICVLNYDYSKRFAIAISPKGHIDIRAIASRVNAIIDHHYAQIAPDRHPAARCITVYADRISGYDAYQQAFADLCRLYDRSFFLREHDVLCLHQAKAYYIPCSMIEAERMLARFSDLLYLRDAPGARGVLDALLLGSLKKAQDKPLLGEVLVFLKKRIQDICLILGVPWTEESAAAFDVEHFICIEELHEALCQLLSRTLSGEDVPQLKPDGIAIRAARYIGKHYYQPLDLSTIADHLHVNPTYLSHAFKSEMRIGMTQYITRIRIEQAQRLLRESDLKISRIAQDVGLPDSRYFNTVFKRHTGCTPTEYRETQR